MNPPPPHPHLPESNRNLKPSVKFIYKRKVKWVLDPILKHMTAGDKTGLISLVELGEGAVETPVRIEHIPDRNYHQVLFYFMQGRLAKESRKTN